MQSEISNIPHGLVALFYPSRQSLPASLLDIVSSIQQKQPSANLQGHSETLSTHK